jgi:hypothetical protein
MGAIAGKKHTAMHESIKARASENIETGPDQLETRMAENALEARHHALGLALFEGISVGSELQVDAQDVVGLAMHQSGMAGMKRRMEPEAAITRRASVSAHIGNEKALLERATGAMETQASPERATCAVGSDDPARLERLGARRRLDHELDAIGQLREPGHTMSPIDPSVTKGGESLNQHRLQGVLRKINESRATVAGLGLQIKVKQFFSTVIDPPDLPCNPAADQRLADAEATHDLKRSS